MPPTNQVDAAYASIIDYVCGLIGYQAAFEALRAEFDKRADATRRQVFRLDGALMSDIADIVKQHPPFGVRFAEQDGNIRIHIVNDQGGIKAELQTEFDEICRKIKIAVANRIQVPGLEGDFMKVSTGFLEKQGDD